MQKRPHNIIVIPLKFTQDIQLNTIEYSLESLITLKTRLNTTKSKLDSYESHMLSKFQRILDIHGSIKYRLSEFNTQIVTNAWLKYWEIFTYFKLVNEKTKVAFFNAELPGAALCAFNHYMKTVVKQNYTWRASSLFPDKIDTTNTALDDRYGLYTHNKDNWMMDSAKNNGDMTILSNILDYVNRLQIEFSGVDFYSHDAGMGLDNDYNNQELINAKLNLGCALCGLLTLKKVGNFNAKQYTFFETFTWNLIFIYSKLFEEFYITKPLTSRPVNSEIYLIGKGFLGISDNIKEILINRLQNFNTLPLIEFALVKQDLLSLGELERAARVIYLTQILTLDENIQLIEKYKFKTKELQQLLEPTKNETTIKWLRANPIPVLQLNDKLRTN